LPCQSGFVIPVDRGVSGAELASNPRCPGGAGARRPEEGAIHDWLFSRGGPGHGKSRLISDTGLYETRVRARPAPGENWKGTSLLVKMPLPSQLQTLSALSTAPGAVGVTLGGQSAPPSPLLAVPAPLLSSSPHRDCPSWCLSGGTCHGHPLACGKVQRH
jgi:hypothetical protein